MCTAPRPLSARGDRPFPFTYSALPTSTVAGVRCHVVACDLDDSLTAGTNTHAPSELYAS